MHKFQKFIPYFFCLVLVCLSFLFSYFLFKPSKCSSDLKIGLVNMQRVRDQSEPFNQWQKALQSANLKAQEKFKSLEENLVKEYELLQEDQQKKKIKPDILASRKQKLDEKAQELENELQKEREQLRQQFDKSILSIETSLEKIVQEYTKENGIDLLLNTQIKDMHIALAGNSDLNHTEQIIKKLNEKIPNIKDLQ